MENSAVDDERSTYIDGENRSKRLSILKPPKSRPPLKDVNFGESIDDTEDFEIARRRRVSFAGVNSIKEFCSNAESLQVCHVQSYEETFSTSSDNSNNSCLPKPSEPTGNDCNFVDDPMDLTDSEAHVLEFKTDDLLPVPPVSLKSQTKQSLPAMGNAIAADVHPMRKSEVIMVEGSYSQYIKTAMTTNECRSTHFTTKTIEKNESKFHVAVPAGLCSMDITEPLEWIKSSCYPKQDLVNFLPAEHNPSNVNLSDSGMEFTQALPQKLKKLSTRTIGEDLNNMSMEMTEPVMNNQFKLVQSHYSAANKSDMTCKDLKMNHLACQNASKTEEISSNGMELTELVSLYPPDNVFFEQNIEEKSGANLNNLAKPCPELTNQNKQFWDEKVSSIATCRDMEMTGVFSLSKCEKLSLKTKLANCSGNMELTDVLPTFSVHNKLGETDCIQSLKEEANCQPAGANNGVSDNSQSKVFIEEPELINNGISLIRFGNNRKQSSPVELSFLNEFKASPETSRIIADNDYAGSIEEIVSTKPENTPYNVFNELGRKSVNLFGESGVDELRCNIQSPQSNESEYGAVSLKSISFKDFVIRKDNDIQNSVANLMTSEKDNNNSDILKGIPDMTCTEEVPPVSFDLTSTTEPIGNIKDVHSTASQIKRDKMEFSPHVLNMVSPETARLASTEKSIILPSRTVLDCEDMDTSVSNCSYSDVPQFPISSVTNLFSSGNMELTEVLPTQPKTKFSIPTNGVSEEPMKLNHSPLKTLSDKLLDHMDISMDETLMRGTSTVCNSTDEKKSIQVNNSNMINSSPSVAEIIRQSSWRVSKVGNNETCPDAKTVENQHCNIALELESTTIADTHHAHARRSLTFFDDQKKIADLEPSKNGKCSPGMHLDNSNSLLDQPTNSVIHSGESTSRIARFSSTAENRNSIFNREDVSHSKNLYSNDTNDLLRKDNVPSGSDRVDDSTYLHIDCQELERVMPGFKKSITEVSSENQQDIPCSVDKVLDDTLITMRKSVAVNDQSSGCFIPSFTFPETQLDNVKNVQLPEVYPSDNEIVCDMDISSLSPKTHTNSVPKPIASPTHKDVNLKLGVVGTHADGYLRQPLHSATIDEISARGRESYHGLDVNLKDVIIKPLDPSNTVRKSRIPIRSVVDEPVEIPDTSKLQRKSCIGVSYAMADETVESVPHVQLLSEHTNTMTSCIGSVANLEPSADTLRTSERKSCVGIESIPNDIRFNTVESDCIRLEESRKPRKSIFLDTAETALDKESVPSVELISENTSKGTLQNRKSCIGSVANLEASPPIHKTLGEKSCAGWISNDDSIMPEGKSRRPRKSTFLGNVTEKTIPSAELISEKTYLGTHRTRKSCFGSVANSDPCPQILNTKGKKSCEGIELIPNDNICFDAVEDDSVRPEVECRKPRKSIFLGNVNDETVPSVGSISENSSQGTHQTRKSCIGSAASLESSHSRTSVRKSCVGVEYISKNEVDFNPTNDRAIQNRISRKSTFLDNAADIDTIDTPISNLGVSLTNRLSCVGIPTKEESSDSKPFQTVWEDSPGDDQCPMNTSNELNDIDDQMHISSTPLKLNDTGKSSYSRKRSHSRQGSLRPIISTEDLANELSQELMNVSLQSDTKSPLPKKMSIQAYEIPSVVASCVNVEFNDDRLTKYEGMEEDENSIFDGLSFETRIKNRDLLKTYSFNSMGKRTWKTTFIKETIGVVIVLPACRFTESTEIESVRYSFHPEKIGKTCFLNIEVVKFLKWKITSEYSEYWLKQNCTKIEDLKRVVDCLNSEINFLRPTVEKLIFMKLIHPCKINRNQLSFTIISGTRIRKFDVTIEINFNRTDDSIVRVTNRIGKVNESCVQLVFRSLPSNKDMFHKFVDMLYDVLPQLCV